MERFDPNRIRCALGRVQELLAAATAGASAYAETIRGIPAERQCSARNLAHYLAVRNHDLRPLQRELADLSLSSLGRMEGNVVDTLAGVQQVMLALLGEPPVAEARVVGELTMAQAERLLDENADRLLGTPLERRQTRIMVNLPTEAATSTELVRDVLEAGVEIVRINLARDDEEVWTAMVRNVRAVSQELGRECRVFADLPGPKLRTGDLRQGPGVVRVRPSRDALGIVTHRARVVFADPDCADLGDLDDGPEDRPIAVVPLARPLAQQLRRGDEIVVTDTRGRDRRFVVEKVEGSACRAAIDRTAYLGTGCKVELRRKGRLRVRSRIGELPPRPAWLPLQVGDHLLVTRAQEPGIPASVDDEAGTVNPARVPCTLPEVFDAVRVGQRILFDDGRIAAVIEVVEPEALRVRITAVPPRGGRLRAQRGINLPDTDLSAAIANDVYRDHLTWVTAHADIVGMSFVQRAEDVHMLRAELDRLGKAKLGIVLKVETARAFDQLPELLFAGLHAESVGVLIARGDLAVEVGYERLAEVQEEMLWLSEAAHLPVIWATQVLDSMARTGMPSRAEVTDAAMGVRAECVMLNKGPYIVPTVRFLGDVLERMQSHHVKKRAMLRRLRVARGRSQGG